MDDIEIVKKKREYKNPVKAVCPHCDEEIEKKTQGAINLHVYHCELKKLRGMVGSGMAAEKKKKAEPKHEHEWRILNENREIEARAIHAGYTQICKSCGEVDE